MEFLLAWAFMPWTVLGLLSFGFICYATENDSPFFASLTLLVTLGLLQAFSSVQPLTFILTQPGWATLIVLAYIVIGPIVGTLKWLSFAHDVADRWAEVRAQAVSYYLARYGKESEKDFTPAEMKNVLERAQSSFSWNRTWDIDLKVSQHKSRITTWMLFWPTTLFWLLLNDPIRRLYNFIYARLGGLLTRISDRAMAPFKTDFVK